MNFTNNILDIFQEKNELKEYNYKDHILGKIELWNADNVFKDINKDKIYSLEIELNKDKKVIKGNYDSENNKLLFDINEKENDISLFDINKILFNFK